MVVTNPSSVTKNVMVIWFHQKNIASEILRYMKLNLNKKFHYSYICDNIQKLTAYLSSDLAIKQIVFIISRDNAVEYDSIKKLVKRRKQYRACYRLDLIEYSSFEGRNNKMRSTIDQVFKDIMDDLERTMPSMLDTDNTSDHDANVSDELTVTFNAFKPVSAQTTFSDLSKESLKFLLTQLLTEIMVRMNYENYHFEQMWNLFHERHFENATEAEKIRNLAHCYTADQAINYYTQDSCIFRLLNEILRLENFETIFKFGCYIADLYKQLKNLENQQIQNGRQNISVFRGKKYPTHIIQQLKDSVGNLITLNGLISTSKSYEVAASFAGIGEKREGYSSVIFEFKIDSNSTNLYRPCADIKTFSQFQDENEVLFFMGFIWKIEFMDNYGTNNWYVVLESYTEYNPELTRYILDARLNYTYSDVGDILQQLGDHVSALNFYQRVLDEDENISDEIRCHIYFNMGVIAEDDGRYRDAINHFKQANNCIKSSESVDIKESAQLKPLYAPSINATKLHIYNNLARSYMKIEKQVPARKFFRDAVEQQGTPFERATVLRNFGLFEFKCRKLEDARRYLEQAVDLVKNDACYGDFKRSLDATFGNGSTAISTSTTSP